MKKFLLVAFALVSVIASYAQTANSATRLAGKSTLKDADTANYYLSDVSYFEKGAIQAIVNNSTGTLGGKVYLFKSMENGNWGTAVDSLTLTDGNNTKIFDLGVTTVPYYRIQVITSGTQVSTGKVLAILRRKLRDQ